MVRPTSAGRSRLHSPTRTARTYLIDPFYGIQSVADRDTGSRRNGWSGRARQRIPAVLRLVVDGLALAGPTRVVPLVRVEGAGRDGPALRLQRVRHDPLIAHQPGDLGG